MVDDPARPNVGVRNQAVSEPPALTPAERRRLILAHMTEQQQRWSRPLGAFGMVMGLVLIAIIGTVAYFIMPALLADGESVDGTRFTGGPGARMLILAILALVAAIGLIAILAGTIQLVTGQRYRPIVRVMLWIAGLLYAAAMAVRLLP